MRRQTRSRSSSRPMQKRLSQRPRSHTHLEAVLQSLQDLEEAARLQFLQKMRGQTQLAEQTAPRAHSQPSRSLSSVSSSCLPILPWPVCSGAACRISSRAFDSCSLPFCHGQAVNARPPLAGHAAGNSHGCALGGIRSRCVPLCACNGLLQEGGALLHQCFAVQTRAVEVFALRRLPHHISRTLG